MFASKHAGFMVLYTMKGITLYCYDILFSELLQMDMKRGQEETVLEVLLVQQISL